MPWFKVDDNLGFHHKVIAAGNPAMGLWVRAGSICAQQLTDGFVPDHMVSALGTTAQAKKLAEVGLWDRVQGGYRFHEWGDRQPSKADVEAERAAAKDRMRQARARKRAAAQESSPQVSAPRSPDVRENTDRTNGEVREMFGNPDPARPDPSRPDPTTSPRELTLHETPRLDVKRIVDHLAQRLHANGVNPKPGKSWDDAARLMLDRDGRTEAQIHAAIDWCQDDEFWRANILSMPKLREKYDQLSLQARRVNGHVSKQQETNDLFQRAAARMGVTGELT